MGCGVVAFHRSGNTRLTILLFLIAGIHKEYYGIGNLVRRYVIMTNLFQLGDRDTIIQSQGGRAPEAI